MQRIAILGTGSALKDLLSILPTDVQVVGLGDNDPAKQGTTIEGYAVESPETIAQKDADLFIISSRAVDPIRAQLIAAGIDGARICAYYPSYSKALQAQVNEDIETLNRVVGLRLPMAGIATMYLWPDDSPAAAVVSSGDFVRTQAFRLAADRINTQGVTGSIAELGVYQGDQAALLSRLFPARTLHLFDTFEGFSSNDLITEKTAGFSGAALGDFANTSVDLVIGKLADPARAVVHKGFFPGTAVGVEDVFAFVSLDVDLYEPTLAGLEYFYPRLAKGGVIFVHDYNSRRYLGVRRAVDGFVAATGAPALAIPDFAGSVVVLK